MESIALIAVNGLLLGLASTLHCAGMCGAISSSIVLCRRAPDERGTGFFLVHAGRITAYVAAGAIAGAVGSPAIAWLDREMAFRVLQWAGASALMWIGLSTAGLMPSLRLLDRYLLAAAGRVMHLTTMLGDLALQRFFAGLAWGLMPCAMVYGGLMTAMLSGSAAGGGIVMFAFGIGTLPGLFAATSGVGALLQIGSRYVGRQVAGLAIAALGFLSILVVHPAASTLCLSAAKRLLQN